MRGDDARSPRARALEQMPPARGRLHPVLAIDAVPIGAQHLHRVMQYVAGEECNLTLILDFEDGDLIQISRNFNGSGITSADDLGSMIADDGGNAVVDFGNGDTLTLVGVSADDVQADPGKYFHIS